MIPLGPLTRRFCKDTDCVDAQQPVGFTETVSTKQWLWQYAGDDPAISTLRNLLIERRSWEYSGIGTDEVLESTADLISCEWLHYHSKTYVPDLPGSAPSQAAGGSPSGPPPPSKPSAPPSSPTPDPPTFPSNTALGQMLNALLAAAAGGMPFAPI